MYQFVLRVPWGVGNLGGDTYRVISSWGGVIISEIIQELFRAYGIDRRKSSLINKTSYIRISSVVHVDRERGKRLVQGQQEAICGEFVILFRVLLGS